MDSQVGIQISEIALLIVTHTYIIISRDYNIRIVTPQTKNTDEKPGIAEEQSHFFSFSHFADIQKFNSQRETSAEFAR